MSALGSLMWAYEAGHGLSRLACKAVLGCAMWVLGGCFGSSMWAYKAGHGLSRLACKAVSGMRCGFRCLL